MKFKRIRTGESTKEDLESSVEQSQSTIAQLNATCADRFLQTVQKVDANFPTPLSKIGRWWFVFNGLFGSEFATRNWRSILAQPPGKKRWNDCRC